MARYRNREVSIEGYPSEDLKVIILYDNAKETVDLRDIILSPNELSILYGKETLKLQRTVDKQKEREEKRPKDPKEPKDPKDPRDKLLKSDINIKEPKAKELKDPKEPKGK